MWSTVGTVSTRYLENLEIGPDASQHTYRPTNFLASAKAECSNASLNAVPFIETDTEIFLKTIIPSRKATRQYSLGAHVF
jgi:hypothetical protein